jgi:hypothetical protein
MLSHLAADWLSFPSIHWKIESQSSIFDKKAGIAFARQVRLSANAITKPRSKKSTGTRLKLTKRRNRRTRVPAAQN